MTRQPISRSKFFQVVGIGGIIISIVVPAALWIALSLLTPYPEQFDLRTLGANTVAATLYAIPIFFVSVITAILATVANLRSQAK